jgi:D-glycero-alpha-D-manno-heptose-7-phosphate kinase
MHVAVAGALAAWTGRTLTDDELLALVMNVEAQVIGVPTGVQDYRPAFYGGVSAVELSVTGVRRIALDVDAEELGRRLVLAYTGASRQSGINNWDVMVRRIGGDPAVPGRSTPFQDAAAGCQPPSSRQWRDLAIHLVGEWESHKRLAPAVTTPKSIVCSSGRRKRGARKQGLRRGRRRVSLLPR